MQAFFKRVFFVSSFFFFLFCFLFVFLFCIFYNIYFYGLFVYRLVILFTLRIKKLCCFLIRKNKLDVVHIIHEDEHILCIKLLKNNKCFIIAGVYLQSCHDNNQSVDLYETQLNSLNGIINSFMDEGEIIILGDFQSFPKHQFEHFNRTSRTFNHFSCSLKRFS